MQSCQTDGGPCLQPGWSGLGAGARPTPQATGPCSQLLSCLFVIYFGQNLQMYVTVIVATGLKQGLGAYGVVTRTIPIQIEIAKHL